MRPKPNSCYLLGCPLAADMEGFVPDAVPDDAEVLVVGLMPSTYEVRTGVNGSGTAAEGYRTDFEGYASGVSLGHTYLIRCRGQSGQKAPSGKTLREGIKFCRQFDKYPETLQAVVWLGVDVAKAMRPDISEPMGWRGYICPSKKEE
jgi:hypothetical protein